MNTRSLAGILAVVAILAFALPATAQIQRGNIYGTVLDNTGAVLPGVTVTLTSNVRAPQHVVSGSQGQFRFVELDPGTYTITASLQGFAPFKRENVIVNVGSNVELPVQMALQGVKQEVTVTAATPVLDERTHGNTTTFGDAVLNEIPTARDPWVLLQQVPGVLVDRINVGGSESGQQSVYSARGDDGTNTMWNMDGVTITDMAAIGSSPTYYDFDVFQEVQFTTGVVDPRQQTGALGINMVTKRGTNSFHGKARYFFDNDRLQGENIPDSFRALGFRGNRINQIADYGGDVGGPIMRNKLWFWGALARNDIRQLTITGAPDNTRLDSSSAKIDFQPISANHFNFFYYRGNKVKIGRNAGVTRPPETTVNQSGPTNIYKFEDAHTFGSRMLATGRFSYVQSGFRFDPQGGMTGVQVYQDLDGGGVWHNSFQQYITDRPQWQGNVDANYFAGKHEVKFGFQYRRTPVTSQTIWPGDVWTQVGPESLGVDDPDSDFFGRPDLGLVNITRRANYTARQQNTSFYVGDTIAMNRVTVDAALRYDRQSGFNAASTSPANAAFADILPALNYSGGSSEFTWNSWSPRVGATLRLNDKTNVRASYGLYQGQLPNFYAVATNPVALAGIAYRFVDDGSHIATPANILFDKVQSVYGFDPANPSAALSSPNQIDPNLSAPKTHSVVVALDRELIPNFAVSTSVGYARTYDLVWNRYIGLTGADFVVNPTATATVAAAGGNSTVYSLAPGSSLPAGSGALIENRPGYHQRYWNWDVTATKRLADRWMVRGYLTLSNNQEFYDDPALAIQDPTPLSNYATGLGTFAPFITTGVDGGIVVNSAGGGSGTRGDVYIHSKWSYSVMGLYQLPFGVQASGTVYGRQGYPSPSYIRINRGALGSAAQVLLNPDLDTNRNPNVHIVDLRGEKSFTYRGVGAILSVDLFNAFNDNSLLQRNRQINATDSAGNSLFGQPREIVAPRVVRFGVRFQF